MKKLAAFGEMEAARSEPLTAEELRNRVAGYGAIGAGLMLLLGTVEFGATITLIGSL